MIELNELRELCIWRMTSDPWYSDANLDIIDFMLDKISQQYGYDDWIDAYHKL